MDLSILKPPIGAIHRKKRVGRGPGSGHGKTSTRGQGGQKAHSKVAPWFEGGQMPLVRRVPKRGFNRPFKRKNQIVNVGELNVFKDGDLVTPEAIRKMGLVKKEERIKILGKGDLNRALKVKAHFFSRQAQDKIKKAKGTIEVI
ncbi:MAG: 50S ribosomal protein L15 [Candidatus Aerophobetes bacterium]|nr:50S ribosomal protein L15 [Candidatus Aerophobetes bacterium]